MRGARRAAVRTLGVALAAALMVVPSLVVARPAPGGSPRWGTELSFYGWSPDARLVAYRRVRRMPPERGRKPRVERRSMHRVVKDGRLEGFGPGFSGTLADHARSSGYRADALPMTREGERAWRFAAPEGVYRLEVTLGEQLGWRLTLNGEVLLGQAFDTPYVRVEPALYPAPDRSALALVMLLDTGWLIDGALYTVALPADVRARWRAAEAASTHPAALQPEVRP